MSNLIKFNYLKGEDSGRKVVKVEYAKQPVIPHIKPKHQNDDMQGDSFSTKGFDISNMERIEEEPEVDPEELIREAKNEADSIIEEAEAEADDIRKSAQHDGYEIGYQEGTENGYQEGYNVGNSKFTAKIKEAEDRIAEYNDLMRELEPKFAKVVMQLVEKFVGVISEEKEDILLTLINNAMLDIESSKQFIIKVSNDDYEYVLSNKESIYGALNAAIQMEIFPDAKLAKNDCLIETDAGIINCGLGVQLQGLLTDIKLLAKI